MSSIRLPAVLLVAAVLLAWIPASEAGTSFSFSIHGGDFRGYGHSHGGRFGHYHGFRSHYYPHPRHYGYPRRHYGYRPYWERDFPYWRPAPGPRCIYRYGNRYCR